MSEDDLLQISIAGRPIGIIGFKAVFEELAPTLAQSSDDVLAQELVTRLSMKNYIPEKVKAEYGKALVREFRRQLGQPIQEEKPSRAGDQSPRPGLQQLPRVDTADHGRHD